MAQAGELDGDTIRFERVYDASIEDVWALWTTKEGLEEWFAPEGMRFEVSILELWVGGAFDHVMTAVGTEQVAYLANLDRPLTARVSGRFVEIVRHQQVAHSLRHGLRPRRRVVSLRHGGRTPRRDWPSSDDPDGRSSPGPRDDARRNPWTDQPAATLRPGHSGTSDKGATTVMRPLLYSINVTLDGCCRPQRHTVG